jgi:hypothetical protein
MGKRASTMVPLPLELISSAPICRSLSRIPLMPTPLALRVPISKGVHCALGCMVQVRQSEHSNQDTPSMGLAVGKVHRDANAEGSQSCRGPDESSARGS